MANTLTGKVHEVRPTQEITGKTGSVFLKRELILDCTRYDPYTGERGYDNYPSVTFAQDKCALLDSLKPGDVVTVGIDIQGRKDPNSDRYYNDVRGYKVEVRKVEVRNRGAQSAPGFVAAQAPTQSQTATDDLPW